MAEGNVVGHLDFSIPGAVVLSPSSCFNEIDQSDHASLSAILKMLVAVDNVTFVL